MFDDFRQRCNSALTHPLTIGAVFALLLNDLVFKSLWPDHWVTGKLSNLAWVVFASPLLAFLLSRLCPRNPLAERGAFAVAYLAFPLLYAAFNTFEPLHDWILRAFLPFTGSTAGSPLDPTDSLVIPFGLALALWIWKRPTVGRERVHARLCVLAAIVAGTATVASSCDEPSPTRWLVGIGGDGTVAIEGASDDLYISDDGGLSWAREGRSPGTDTEWGGAEVNTARGTYSIQGAGIVRTDSMGKTKEVYSTVYLQDESNAWAQRYSTKGLRSDLTDMYSDAEQLVSDGPVNIVYDERTGNLVVAMGLQGALVGTPGEEWHRVTVGRFAPTDFSFLAKARLMLSAGFWLASLGFSLSVIAATLVFWEGSGRADGPVYDWHRVLRRVGIGLLLFVVSAPLLFIFMPSLFAWIPVPFLIVYLFSIPLVLPIGLTAFTWTLERDSLLRVMLVIGVAVGGIICSIIGFPPFGGSAPGSLFEIDFERVAAVTGLAFALTALAMNRPRTVWLVPLVAALAAMNASIALAFVVWLTDGLVLALATIAALALVVLTAVMLLRHLNRQGRPQST